MKIFYRLKDNNLSAKFGVPVYLAQDLASPTDKPNEAFVTSRILYWLENFDFEIEPLPTDQQMHLNNQTKLPYTRFRRGAWANTPDGHGSEGVGRDGE